MEKKATPAQLVNAYKAAVEYYLHPNSDGSLKTQREVAKKIGVDPARLSERLDTAWKEDLIVVFINSPEGIGRDYYNVRGLEIRALEKLQQFSPHLRGSRGKTLSERRLRGVHITPRSGGPKNEEGNHSSDTLHATEGHLSQGKIIQSIMARTSIKAASLFYDLIRDHHRKSSRRNELLYAGIGWSRTADRIVNLMPIASEPFSNLIICPLIGIMGHRETYLDANFLAHSLSERLGADSRKLPYPCIKPPHFRVKELRSVSRALEDINCCSIAISGLGVAFHENKPFNSRLVERKMITQKTLNKIKGLGAVAELQCNYFDINGKHIPYSEIGFEPVGITVKHMKTISRYLIVARPNREAILPAVVSIKTGICTDLFIDVESAFYLLDEKNEEELRLRPEDAIT